jgi:hypothetical protein
MQNKKSLVLNIQKGYQHKSLAKFKMHKKPTFPVRMKNIRIVKNVNNMTGLQMLHFLKELKEVDLTKAFMSYSGTIRHTPGFVGPFIEYYKPETSEEFEKRVEKYNKDTLEYDEWYDENEEKILETLELERILIEAKIQRKKEAHAKEIKELEKLLTQENLSIDEEI